jgi:hypothetical protein
VPDVSIAVVIIDPSIEEKIRTKHAPLTGEDVRQALVYARDVEAGWEDDPEHGTRVVAHASTYSGTEFVAYLMPANEGDPEEGTFILKTAIPETKT